MDHLVVSAETSSEEWIVDRQEQVDRAISRAAFRFQLPLREHDDFTGWAWLRLLDNRAAILAGWRRECSLATYLHTVCGNLARDYRIRLFGRWRSSRAARRLGDTAELAERMLYRERLSYDELRIQLRQRFGKERSETRLARFLGRLPMRQRPRPTPLDDAPALAETGGVEARVEARDLGRQARRVRTALLAALGELSRRERSLLRERFENGLSVAALARRTGEADSRLYREMQRALGRLRRGLEARGVGPGLMRDVLEAGALRWRRHRCAA